MMSAHFPALSVALPLIMGPIIGIIRERHVAWFLAAVSLWASFAMSISLLMQTMNGEVISYALGGWEPPWGIEYRVDVVNALVLCIVSGIGAVCALYARESVDREIEAERQPLFYTMFLLVIAGLMGIAITGDAFNAFVFLEISSLSTYTLVAMGSHRKALVASYQYLVMGTAGATFYLIGVGLLYQMTGTLNIADLQERLVPVAHTTPVIAGFGFITVGLFIKIALFPLHQWLPNAYAYAPSVVTAILAGTATKVSIYLFMRLSMTMFGIEYSFGNLPTETIIAILAVTGMFVGSSIAIFQTDAKRLLAYSSVGQVGYMLLGISMASATGLTAAMVHMANHAVIKSGLFLAMGIIFYRMASVDQDALKGLSRRMPLTAFAIVLGGLALIGVPLTAGFISKWTLVTSALEQNMWPIAMAIFFSSLLAVVYVWRLVEMMYFQAPDMDTIEDSGSTPPLMFICMWVLIGLCYVFGIFTDYTLGMAERAAEALINGWY